MASILVQVVLVQLQPLVQNAWTIELQLSV